MHEFLKKMPVDLLFAGAIILAVFLGYVDYITGWQVKFTLFYLIPLLFTLYLGRTKGVVLAILCGLAATSTEISWDIPYVSPLIPYWNAFSRLLMFVAFALLVAKIKDQMSKLENTISSCIIDLETTTTDKEQLEQEKNEIYDTLQTTLENLSEGFVSLDRQWRCRYVNKAAERIIGMAAAHLIGEVYWDLFPDAASTLAYREMHRSLEQGRELCFEEYLPEPHQRWYENRCYPSENGVSIFFNDITERKAAELKSRDLSDHLELVREQERLTISREIHDDFGQTLTALKLDLSLIEHKFLPYNQELTARVHAMRSSMDELIGKAQNIAAELRPPLLDNLGLAAAIDWQARELKRRSGIECHLMLNEDVQAVNREVATAIMRILQEALTNIARHSGAGVVCISLCRKERQTLVLEIYDDGRGIRPEELNSSLSFGLMGMQERARICHGTLAIQGETGGGTTVRLEIPACGA